MVFIGIYACLWVSGCLWVSMGIYGFHGCLWVLMGFYYCVWVFKDVYWLLWVFMGFWVSMGIYGFLSVYGYLWVSWVYMCVYGYLQVLYLNIKKIACFLIQKPQQIKERQKSLRSHMYYKKRVCTMGGGGFLLTRVFSIFVSGLY